MSGKKDTAAQDPKGAGCKHSEHPTENTGTCATERQKTEQEAIARRMSKVAHKIIILSGKGGVGKSTVAVNMAAALVLEGKKVGLMDIDIHGPSITNLLSVSMLPYASAEGGIMPAKAFEGLSVMSIGYFLEDKTAAVIWRGPMKHGMIRQFLSEVEWGDLDYLIVDSPPGTGDEPLSIAQLIQGVDGAVIVTTPQAIAVDDVRRSISFCRKVSLSVLGVVENMSGFICPHCGKESDIFKRGGGAAMADQMKVRYLGDIPIDPAIVRTSDEGVPFIKESAKSPTALAFQRVIESLLNITERNKS